MIKMLKKLKYEYFKVIPSEYTNDSTAFDLEKLSEKINKGIIK
jgi:hypothetical protein